MRSPSRCGSLVAVVVALALAGCGSDAADGDGEGDGGLPAVDLIEPAMTELAGVEGADVELYQATATVAGVELVLARGGEAVGYTYLDGVLAEAASLGPAEGYTFVPSDVAFDPEHVLDGVVDELEDPIVTRFEVVAGPDGVVYAAEVLSEAGGSLIVDLGPDGAVLGVAPAT